MAPVPGILYKDPKYGFDTLVFKGIRVGEQRKEFQIKNNLFPFSFNRNMILKNFILKIFLKLCKEPEPWKEHQKSEPELCQNGTVP